MKTRPLTNSDRSFAFALIDARLGPVKPLAGWPEFVDSVAVVFAARAGGRGVVMAEV